MAAGACMPSAAAHLGGLPILADPIAPHGLTVLGDEPAEVRWLDGDAVDGVETTTVEIFVTERPPPPTFGAYDLPGDLGGVACAPPVDVVDTGNSVRCPDVSRPGVFYAYSKTIDPPLTFLRFSPGAFVVPKPDGSLPPAIVVMDRGTEPIVEASHTIEWETYGATGATVTIEFALAGLPDERTTLVSGVEPTASGSLTWDTSALPLDDYQVRASLHRDGEELAHGWGRWFVYVRQPLPELEADDADASSEDEVAAPPGLPQASDSGGCATAEPSWMLPPRALARR